MVINYCDDTHVKLTITPDDAAFKRLSRGDDLNSGIGVDYIKFTTEQDGENIIVTYESTMSMEDIYDAEKDRIDIKKELVCLRIKKDGDFTVVRLPSIRSAFCKGWHYIICFKGLGSLSLHGNRGTIRDMPGKIMNAPFMFLNFRKMKDKYSRKPKFRFMYRKEAFHFMLAAWLELKAEAAGEPRKKGDGYMIWQIA